MNTWQNCRKILCVRLDNMGDLVMSGPAIRALKESFNVHITVLTSGMASGMTEFLPSVDQCISFDAPWLKNDSKFDPSAFNGLINRLRNEEYDGAVLFSVYSQSILPAALLLYLAGIPLRAGYCRENPYALLTHWLPDAEPYNTIRHQVRRDLDLVASIGATTSDDSLRLTPREVDQSSLFAKLERLGLKTDQRWLVVHTGVSENKRAYPSTAWKAIITKIVSKLGYQVVLTGSAAQRDAALALVAGIKEGVINVAGKIVLRDFISLVGLAPLVITVNTSTAHIAAATGTPQVLLYALTNPQHLPWKGVGSVLYFNVPPDVASRNEVIKHVAGMMQAAPGYPSPEEVLHEIKMFLSGSVVHQFPELVPLAAEQQIF